MFNLVLSTVDALRHAPADITKMKITKFWAIRFPDVNPVIQLVKTVKITQTQGMPKTKANGRLHVKNNNIKLKYNLSFLHTKENFR